MAVEPIKTNTPDGARLIHAIQSTYRMFDQIALAQNKQQFEPTQRRTVISQ